MRILKYKNIFAKGYNPNRSEGAIVEKNTALWTYVTQNLSGEEIVETFYKKITKNKSNWIEKVIKKKGYKLQVTWKGYNNSFNECIDKNVIA